MKISRTPRVALVTAVAAVAAVIISIGAPAAADPPVVVAQVTTADYHVELTTSGAGSIDVAVTNTSSSTISFGLEATLNDSSTYEPVWTSPWAFLADAAREDVSPGNSYTTFVPAWSGMGLRVVTGADGTPVPALDYRVPGPWFGFDVQSVSPTALALQFGSHVSVSPAAGRPGESLFVQATGLGITTAEVWVVEASALDINVESSWDFSVDNARSLGTVPVSGGAVSAWVAFPSDLAPGDYAVLVGAPGGAFVPGGPAVVIDEASGDTTTFNVQLEAGLPRNTSPGGTQTVIPRDQTGAQAVSFAYTAPAGPGTATVTSSTTAPPPSGFSALVSSSPAYYELTSTVPLNGTQVLVCISFDTTGLSAADAANQHLYHYVSGVWVDITASSSTGQVCGTTTSFSPFAVGKPLPAPPTTWPFTGFLDPVSSASVTSALAGTVIPIRFKVGGDRGLGILASGSPASGTSACTVGAVAPSKVPTTALLPSQPLQYAKASQTYWYLWKTNSSWAGTCRQFVLTLSDGSVHTATIKFAKVGLASIIQAIIKIF